MQNDTVSVSYFIVEITRANCENQTLEANPHKSVYDFYNYIVLFLSPLNVLLNGFSLHIFTHRAWKNSTMSCILKSLSIFEICFGTCLLLHTITHSILEQYIDTTNADNRISETFFPNKHVSLGVFIMCVHPVLSGALFAFQITRNWSVVLLAAYRYDSVCRGIGRLSAFSRASIPLIMSITLFLSCCVALPRVFELRSYLCEPTGKIYKEEALIAADTTYQLVYIGIVTFVVQSGGPVLCVCVLSFFVIRQISLRRRYRRQNQRALTRLPAGNPACAQMLLRADAKGTDRSQPSGDKLILALCLTFFILETPAFFSKILGPYIRTHYYLVDLYLSVIANLLIFLDSTFNVFVYMASNPTFRYVAQLLCKSVHSKACSCCQLLLKTNSDKGTSKETCSLQFNIDSRTEQTCATLYAASKEQAERNSPRQSNDLESLKESKIPTSF